MDFPRLLASHGVASLPPQRVERERGSFEATIEIAPGRAATVRVHADGDDACVAVAGPMLGAATRQRLLATVARMLALDEDLSGFYARCRNDDTLSWASTGAGRMLRSPTVFEDAVKTICTTNCAWSATVRMVTSLVEHLGTRAPDGRAAFPSAQAMASAGPSFYREVVRAGYRARYLRALAEEVAAERVDLEALRDPSLSDTEVTRALLALPGIGPYAAAHIMLVALGRYRRLVLDSWTRPTYARLAGGTLSDARITERFQRFGPYAGLAFWLVVTKEWVSG